MRLNVLPSPGDIFFVLILILFLFQLPNFLFTDGSLGWHLVTGNYILAHQHVPHTDLFSFTFPDKTWIAYEWLFDVIAALIFKIGGTPLLGVITSAWLGIIFLSLYRICRARGCHFVLVLCLLTVGLLASSIHFLVRPHLIVQGGVLLYSWALSAFLRQEISGKKLIAALSLFMIFWVNMHPGFIIGLAMIAIVLATNAAMSFWSLSSQKQLKRSECSILLIALIVTALATLLNPYGISLFGYILHYLSQTAILAETNEYASPVFHGQLPFLCLELLYGGLLLGLYMAKKRPPLPEFVLTLAFAHLSLVSVRNIPLFVAASLPFISSCFAGSFLSQKAPEVAKTTATEETTTNKKQGALASLWYTTDEIVKQKETGIQVHLIPILCTIALALSCLHEDRLFGTTIINSTFDPKKLPTETLMCMQSNNLPEKQGLINDNWGGYINFLTGRKVFIDDRSDFYGQEFCLQYGNMVMLHPGWQNLLEHNQISWVLFPPNSLLALELKRHPDWEVLCTDAASILMQKKSPELQQ